MPNLKADAAQALAKVPKLIKGAASSPSMRGPPDVPNRALSNPLFDDDDDDETPSTADLSCISPANDRVSSELGCTSSGFPSRFIECSIPNNDLETSGRGEHDDAHQDEPLATVCSPLSEQRQFHPKPKSFINLFVRHKSPKMSKQSVANPLAYSNPESVSSPEACPATAADIPDLDDQDIRRELSQRRQNQYRTILAGSVEGKQFHQNVEAVAAVELNLQKHKEAFEALILHND
mmetsp:Transcript_17433/g.37943  ORF Transcript_17433/g.37943 Transcript_17433/m.37943 type:complete len:235 (-) Transcript_17433:128-832(-)|eukprot:CAMPEP_0118926000 /NCGR_PEP_ID=MMETSP1169-20130426/3800_1 /TAXON_ID=36882 /ORGANISM="Pyramimonas obovata, Strain CCMP722" /LENGTH=234 /DNA_ID=CAMNT_0006867455 /DNA_START=119 /DNA_END=823 /DNA_ORIENTATION=-